MREDCDTIENVKREEFLTSLDEILELPPGTLTGPEQLDDLENWNSMAVIAFIALADTNGAQVAVRDIRPCRTVNDLLALATV